MNHELSDLLVIRLNLRIALVIAKMPVLGHTL